MAWYHQNEPEINEVRSVVLEGQVVDTVLPKANVTDKSVSYEEAVKPVGTPQADLILTLFERVISQPSRWLMRICNMTI